MSQYPPPNVDDETENVDVRLKRILMSVKLRESSSNKNGKSTISYCWKYFIRIGVGDDGK